MLPAVLRNRAFARLWAAQSITQFGSQLTYLALPMAAWHSTGSAMTFGAVFMASSAGIVLTMLVGGALADRFDRRRMMLLSDGSLFFIVGALGAAVVAERWVLVAVIAFLQSTVASLLRANEALRRDLLADDERMQGSALVLFSMNLTSVVAPVAGAALYVGVGFAPIVAIDLVTIAVSFILLLGVRDPRAGTRTTEYADVSVLRRTMSDIAAGTRVVAQDRWLRAQVPGNLVSGFANGVFLVAVVPWIDVTLGMSASMFGVIVATVGISGLVSSMVVTRIHSRLDPTRLIIIAGVGGVIASAAFVAPPHVPIIFIALFMFGAMNVAGSVGATTVRQRRFEGDLQGRLGSLEMVSGQVMGIVGMATAGILGDQFDPAVAIEVFGVGVALSCIGDILSTIVLVRDPIVAGDVAKDSDLAVSG